MSNEVESWEERAEAPAQEQQSATEKPKSKFSAKFSLDAPAFVPSFTPNAAPTAPTPAAPAVPSEQPAKPAAEEKPAPTTTEPAHREEDELEDEQDDLEDDDEDSGPRMASDGVMRKHLNIVFIGHVDAGKSTISGHLMYLTGMLDERTLEKFEREAKAKGRESWKYAWALDTTDQERAKGKTEEVGRASFMTATKRFTILDAPGHKAFVPHMIGGAAQADVGVLVISARKGEFETGFERGGQTREHAMLAKTTGVRQLVVVINKMDDPTVEWDKGRYDECVSKLSPYLKQVGYNLKQDVMFMPVSGISGQNLKERLSSSVCTWYDGPSLLEYLDNIKPPERLLTAQVRMIINDKYRDMGTVVMGKLESGTIRRGQHLLMLPNNVKVEVLAITLDGVEATECTPGDNPKLRVRGIEEEDVHPGFVLCEPDRPAPVVRMFDAQLVILEHKSILCAGYSSVLHAHSAVEECVIEKLLAIVDRKTNEIEQKYPKFVKPGQTVRARISVAQPVCVDNYKEFPQMGRFMLRDEGKTVAVGVVLKLVKPN